MGTIICRTSRSTGLVSLAGELCVYRLGAAIVNLRQAVSLGVIAVVNRFCLPGGCLRLGFGFTDAVSSQIQRELLLIDDIRLLFGFSNQSNNHLAKKTPEITYLFSSRTRCTSLIRLSTSTGFST